SVTITGSDYGWIQAKAPAGATCTATADADGSQISDPNLGAPQTAGADGVLQWRYQQQGERSGTGHNIVTCTLGPASGSATNEFNVGN
ncbi:MAG TPA: hypothetical protein VG015_00380, partial [Candidatus Dormibacteraeota bacterium]|nr:hypothetical protein [Candidatus Dormibacteraeota bacterium]